MPAAEVQLIGLLLQPDGFTTTDEAERATLDKLRARLAERMGAGSSDLEADPRLVGDLNALVREFELSGEAGADSVARMRGRLLRDENRHAEAVTVYDELLARDPDDVDALFWSAANLTALGRSDEATGRFRTLAGRDDLDPDDLVVVAEQLAGLGDPELAADLLTRAAGGEPALSEESRLQAGDLWSDLGQPAKALELLGPLLEGEGEPSDEEIAAHLLAAQVSFLEQGDPAATVSVMTRLQVRLGTLAEYPVARVWLGYALTAVGRHREALEHLDAGLADEVPPSLRPFALLGRGTALVNIGDLTTAEPCLTGAAPDLVGDMAVIAHVLLTMVRIGGNRTDEARQSADEAWSGVEEANPVVRGRAALWRAIAWHDDEAKLRAGLDEADRLLPADWPERQLLAFWQALALAAGEPERALALLDSIGDVPPEWLPGMANARMAALAALERWDEALVALAPLGDGGPSVQDRSALAIRRAHLLLRAGRAQDALDVVAGVEAAAMQLEEVAAQVLQVQAQAATALDDRELLDAALSQIAERNPALRPIAAFAHGESLLLADDPAGAAEVFRGLEEPDDAANPLAWAVAAQARQYAGRADAMEAVEEALRLDPEAQAFPPLRITQAIAAARRGDVEAVDTAYGPIATLPDHRTLYRYLRAGALREAGDSAATVAELDVVVEQAHEAPSRLTAMLGAQALADKAVLLVTDRRLDAAQAALDQAEEAVAGLAAKGTAGFQVLLARGMLLSVRGDHQGADEAFAAAEPLTGILPPAANLAFLVDFVRGVNWLMAGPDAAEDARRWLSSAVRRKPDDADALHYLGEVYLTLEDPQAALDAFERSLAAVEGVQADPVPCARRDKAAALRRLGRLEEAVRTGRDAVAAEPNDGRNWLSLGASQLELDRVEAAAIAFGRGWRLRPPPSDRVSTQLLLGLTKARLDGGEPDAALAVLDERRARRLAAQQPLVELNRAVALWRLDRHEEAADALDAAGRSDTARALRQSRTARESWLGFWFGHGVSTARRWCGCLLVVAAALAMIPVVVDAEGASWLGWVAPGNVRPLVPLIVVALLFLLPVTTKIKLGDVEIEQPAPVAPILTEPRPVSWDAVERAVKALSTAALMTPSSAGLPAPEPAATPVVDVTVSTLEVAATVPTP